MQKLLPGNLSLKRNLRIQDLAKKFDNLRLKETPEKRDFRDFEIRSKSDPQFSGYPSPPLTEVIKMYEKIVTFH